MKIIEYPIAEGEDLTDAIMRAGQLAIQNNANGYNVVCPRCRRNILDCKGRLECAQFISNK